MKPQTTCLWYITHAVFLFLFSLSLFLFSFSFSYLLAAVKAPTREWEAMEENRGPREAFGAQGAAAAPQEGGCRPPRRCPATYRGGCFHTRARCADGSRSQALPGEMLLCPRACRAAGRPGSQAVGVR